MLMEWKGGEWNLFVMYLPYRCNHGMVASNFLCNWKNSYRIGGVAGKSPERRWREHYPKKWRRWTLSLSSLLYSLWVANCKKETLLGSVQFFAIGAGIRWVRSISRCITQIPISTFIYFSFLLDNSYTCATSLQKSPTKALLHKLYLVRAYSLTLYC